VRQRRRVITRGILIIMMRTKIEEDDDQKILCCASCGIAGVDDIKLKACNDCKSIHYCSDTCQTDHRPQHERECEKGSLNSLTSICSSSQKALIGGTARFAFCRY